jgi:hypothetical protein
MSYAEEMNEEVNKKLRRPKGYDSLAHIKDPKTGKYDLKLHSKARAIKNKKR